MLRFIALMVYAVRTVFNNLMCSTLRESVCTQLKQTEILCEIIVYVHYW